VIDAVKFGLLAMLTLIFVYLVLRVGTFAVLRSIAEFRRADKSRQP
jgi:hypothetical protein